MLTVITDSRPRPNSIHHRTITYPNIIHNIPHSIPQDGKPTYSWFEQATIDCYLPPAEVPLIVSAHSSNKNIAKNEGRSHMQVESVALLSLLCCNLQLVSGISHSLQRTKRSFSAANQQTYCRYRDKVFSEWVDFGNPCCLYSIPQTPRLLWCTHILSGKFEGHPRWFFLFGQLLPQLFQLEFLFHPVNQFLNFSVVELQFVGRLYHS